MGPFLETPITHEQMFTDNVMISVCTVSEDVDST